jgi:MYXO-CTERM domain-containing protein
MRRYASLPIALLALGCGPAGPDRPVIGEARLGQTGVPVNGYPNYEERLQLVAQNRARSDPNNVPAGTAAACSTVLSAQPPLDYEHDAAQSARFHSSFLMLNSCPLNHYSYCTLRSDIEATGCDGSAACACNGGECWPAPLCDANDNGCGNDPGSRMNLFGFFPASTWGENGAAGYATAWDAVGGWVTECPPPIDPTEGHRLNVMSANFNVVGPGSYRAAGGCWSVFYFSDYGDVLPQTLPRIPSGVHRPENGSTATTFSFYANWYDAGGDPQSIDVVVDGVCHPMTVEIGTDVGNRTYIDQRTLPAGCREYYILARDSGGVRVTYPEVGSLLVEVNGGPCAGDYAGTQLPASCESSADAGVPLDAAAADGTADTGPAVDSGATSDVGAAPDASPAPDGGFAPDASPPDTAVADTGTSPDRSVPREDSGVAARDGAGDAGAEPEGAGGCSCALGPSAGERGAPLALLMVAFLWRRRRRTASPRADAEPSAV